MGGDDEVSGEAAADDGEDGDGGEDGVEDDAGDELACSTFAAEAVAEDGPAELSEGGELSAALGRGPGLGGGFELRLDYGSRRRGGGRTRGSKGLGGSGWGRGVRPAMRAPARGVAELDSLPTMSRKISSRVRVWPETGPSGLRAWDAGAELFEGALGDEVASGDDGDVGAEALDDLEDVGGEEDGGAAGDHALEHGFEGSGGDGVDAFEGLVEEEDAGAVDDGGGEGEFFLHAVGEVGDELAGFVGEAHEFEQLGGAGGGGGGVEAVHAADEAQILGCGEAAEEGEAFGDDADLTADVGGVGGGIESEDIYAAGGGCERPVSILMVVDLPAPLGPRKP